MYYFCTYFDKNYLDKGLALYHSLSEHCQPSQLWILCLDDEVYRALANLKLPSVTLISLAAFEWENKKLAEAKQNRSLIEYYFTCTPSLIDYVIQYIPKDEVITYLDADLFFFSPIQPIYKELRNGSILIVGHRFPEQLKHLEKYGKYNIGLVSFRNNNNGITCLRWWRDRCLEWCYDRLEDGKFADQKYLDDWETRFTGMVVLKNKAIGLAPWNLADWKEDEVIMYHFHGVKKVRGWNRMWDIGISDYCVRLTPLMKYLIYVPYLKELEKHNQNNPIQIRSSPKIKNYFKKVLYGDYIILM
jgi:hypothetical protein